MKVHSRPLALILLVWAATSLLNLGGPRLWDIDEPRNAGCAFEMQQRADWIVPTFNAELRTHKPVLLYWAMRASYAGLGVTEFAARLPSALAGLGTILLTYLIGLRLFDRQAALLAAIALPTTMMFTVASRAATPDALLIVSMTGALAVYVWCIDWHAVAAPGRGDMTPSWPRCVAMYLLLGIATLAKGPVGAVLPTAVIGLFLLIQMRARPADRAAGGWRERVEKFARQAWSVWNPKHFLITCWRMRPITALVCIAVVALTWFWAVTVATDGAWPRGFFFEHNAGRVLRARENHGGFVLYYPIALIVGSFPWSIFWIPAALFVVRILRSAGPNHRAVQFLACWLGVTLGLFTLAQTKLPSYITPCYPAWCLLTALLLRTWIAEAGLGEIRWAKLAFQAFACVGIALGIALPVAAHYFIPGEEWFGVAGIPCVAGGFVSLRAIRRGQLARAVTGHAVAAVAFAVCVLAVFPVRIDRHRPIDALITAADPANHRLAVYAANPKPSWVFYARRPLQRFGVRDHGNVARFLQQERTRLIVARSRLDPCAGSLPIKTRIVAEVPAFLGDEAMVVIERDPASIVATRPQPASRRTD
jgi:4-amino-4-deoxy-L-arabinose transferase-like glycosyltransferase